MMNDKSINTGLLKRDENANERTRSISIAKSIIIVVLVIIIIIQSVISSNTSKKLSGAQTEVGLLKNYVANNCSEIKADLNPTVFHVHRIYADANNVSRWEDIYINMTSHGNIGSLSQEYVLTSMDFRYTPGSYNFPPHPSPRRQFVVNLQNGVKITTGDNVTRLLDQGEVFLLEDTYGTGHVSVAVNGLPRYSLFIGLDDHTTFPIDP